MEKGALAMATATHDELSAELRQTISRVEKGRGMSLLWLPVLPFMIGRMLHNGRLVRESIRNTAELCDQACDKVECLDKFQVNSRKIRDEYFELMEILSDLPIPKFALNPIERELAGWDDLVEDCYMGSQDKFRNLIKQIAERA